MSEYRPRWASLTGEQQDIAASLTEVAQQLWADPNADLSIGEALEIAALQHERAVRRETTRRPKEVL